MTTTTISIPVDNLRLASIVITAMPAAKLVWFYYGEYDVPHDEVIRLGDATRAPSATEAVLLGGHEVKMRTCGGEKRPLTIVSLADALAKLLSEGNRAACMFLQGREDAAMADVILQTAVFGEVVYV